MKVYVHKNVNSDESFVEFFRDHWGLDNNRDPMRRFALNLEEAFKGLELDSVWGC